MKPWCRCAHVLARDLYNKTVARGACLSGSWQDEETELRKAMIREAEDALNWVGHCRCRERPSQ